MANEAAKAFGKLSIPWGVEGSQTLVWTVMKPPKATCAYLSQEEDKLCGEGIEAQEGMMACCVWRIVVFLVPRVHSEHVPEHSIHGNLREICFCRITQKATRT